MNPGMVYQHGFIRAMQKIAQAAVSKKLIGRTGDGTKVMLVDGEGVRDLLDVEYGLGAHSLCREYVPEGEIWIERLPSVTDMEANLAHELVEFYLMKYVGMGYKSAHARAREIERMYRRFSKTASIEKRAINFGSILGRAGGWLRGIAGRLGGGLTRANLALRNIGHFFAGRPRIRLGELARGPRATMLPPPPTGAQLERTMVNPFGKTHISPPRPERITVGPGGHFMATRESGTNPFGLIPQAGPSVPPRGGSSLFPDFTPPRIIDPVPLPVHLQQAQSLFRQVPLPPKFAPLGRLVGRPVAPTFDIAKIRTFPAQYYSLGGASL